jgi:parallel beta-helix repeat protein
MALTVSPSARTPTRNHTNIELDDVTASTIAFNVADNALYDGILLDAKATGNALKQNTLTGNGHLDAEDDSRGSGTAGTANTWANNVGVMDNHQGGLLH